jgi:hypothetical protein
MKEYQKVNYAQVTDMTQLDNEQVIVSRASYIELQLTHGLRQKIENYKKKNPNLFLWKYFINNSTDLLLKIEAIYQNNKKNPVFLFQLEQILGQVEYLFDNREHATDADFQRNLENIKLLAISLSGHDSPSFRYLGTLLILLAITAIISSAFVLSMSGLGAGIGIFVGAVLLISGIYSIYNSYQKGLSLGASSAVDSMAQIGDTLRYYDESVAPMLTTSDSEHIRAALEQQLNLGFPAKILKDTLIWARNRHALMPQLIVPENYNAFFHRIANICYVPLTDTHWLRYQRQSVEEQDQPIIANGQVTENEQPTNKRFTSFFGIKAHTCNALTYFDESVSERLRKGFELMKKPLNQGSIALSH